MYVRVRGGPLTTKYRPRFSAAHSWTGRNGMCRATVNKIGICSKEPCPGGGRFTKLMKPWEFENGRKPKPLHIKNFNSSRYQSANSDVVRVYSMTIRSSKNPQKIFARFFKTRSSAHIWLTTEMSATVTCETSKNTKGVTFYIQGVEGRTDLSSPYSIAGDYRHWETKQVFYAPWKYNVNRKVMIISCKAFGSMTQDWFTVEVSTNFGDMGDRV